ncbi:MAG: hypothetical protein V3V08_06115 [Nannocystaceae bacterium]
MQRRQITTIGARGVVFLAAVGLTNCTAPPTANRSRAADELPAGRVAISGREGRIRQFPCEGCHDKVDADDMPVPDGPAKHQSIEIAHFSGARSCNICHDPTNRDRLRLLKGSTTSFDASHLQCGQCHGEKMRDWNIGAHGKHVGGWRGTKHRLTCVDCHNPHKPARATMQAEAPPAFPRFGIPKGAH